ncbi:MAG: hypothetical protein QM778_06980 [Myxococcales bacterium]
MVVVQAEASLVSELQAVEAETDHERSVVARARTGKPVRFPLSFTLRQHKKPVTRLSVRALRGDVVLSERSADVRFESGRQLAWYVYLSAHCSSGCAGEHSCDACGVCAPNPACSARARPQR